MCLAGTRDARAFLKKLGVGGKLAQTLVERYGLHTEACLRKDPYSALFSIPGVSFRCRSPLYTTHTYHSSLSTLLIETNLLVSHGGVGDTFCG